MPLDSRTSAILLLTVSLGKSDDATSKPLSVNEWAQFAAWLRDCDLQPEVLLQHGWSDLLSGWTDRAITLPRIESLLGRSVALALHLEKWERAGLRVLTRADAEYPPLFKERLRSNSPPVLFVSGNTSLLNNGGIAIVGSRNATEEDRKFTYDFADQASTQGYSIVSGGARGIDQSAMLGALEKEGTAVGVLSSRLLADASSAKYRKYIMSGDLTLISPFNPEAGFNVGNAMGRNRYIYCLANAAVVINCDLNKGGTWKGAIENLKARWRIPLWVKENHQPDSGNRELVERGGQWLPEVLTDMRVLLDGNQTKTEPAMRGFQVPKPPLGISHSLTVSPDTADEFDEIPNGLAFYNLFMEFMERTTTDKPLSSKEIAETIEVKRGQVEDWLKRGVEENRIEKLSKPTRYKLRMEKSLLPAD